MPGEEGIHLISSALSVLKWCGRSGAPGFDRAGAVQSRRAQNRFSYIYSGRLERLKGHNDREALKVDRILVCAMTAISLVSVAMLAWSGAIARRKIFALIAAIAIVGCGSIYWLITGYSAEVWTLLFSGLSAIGSVAAAIATIWVALYVQKASHEHNRIAAMREFSTQWQDYNLAVLSDGGIATALIDDYGPGCKAPDIQRMFHVFFRLTNLHQLHYAAEQGAVDQQWCELMIKDIGMLCTADAVILRSALNGHGYRPKFVQDFKRLTGFE